MAVIFKLSDSTRLKNIMILQGTSLGVLPKAFFENTVLHREIQTEKYPDMLPPFRGQNSYRWSETKRKTILSSNESKFKILI